MRRYSVERARARMQDVRREDVVSRGPLDGTNASCWIERTLPDPPLPSDKTPSQLVPARAPILGR